MPDYSDLIAQLEAAETRDECVSAFHEIEKEVSDGPV
jgi:hypothetical protein